MGEPAPLAVKFEDVSVTLEGVKVLESVTASVPQGSSTAIIGPNGAGKTTLLLALLGQKPYRGAIRLANESGGRPRIGYVPQRLTFDRGLPLTVLDFMLLGKQRRPLWAGSTRLRRDQARAILGSVGADQLARRRLGALSGGELQRVLLALALQEEPELIVLDEPEAGVDFRGERLLCELLENLRRERPFTQLMVSHDLFLVTAHASHVICLNRRVTGEGPTAETLNEEVLQATFGTHAAPHGLRWPPPGTRLPGHGEAGHVHG